MEQSTELTLEYGDENAKWYSFTATEEGYYSIDGSCTSGNWNIYLYPSLEESYNYLDSVYISSGYSGSLLTGKMKAGDILYVKACTYYNDGIKGTLTVKKLPEIAWEEQTDGTYLAKSDAYSIKLTPETGYANIRYTVAIEANENSSLETAYEVLCRYNKQGSSYSEEYTSYLYSNNDNEYLDTYSFYAGSNTAYELSFILEDSSDNIIAVLAGDLIFTTTGSTEDAVYIHKTESTETSITMDWEKVDSDVYSYYWYAQDDPPEEISESKNVIDYNAWKTDTFPDLQPATAYVFQFTNYKGKVLYTTTVNTKESDVKIEYTSAEITADCNSLNVTATLSGYTGDLEGAYLYCEFTDALGQMKTDFIYKSFTDKGWSNQDFTFYAPFATNTSYDVTFWVQIGGTGTKWGKTEKTVKSPAISSELSPVLTVASDESMSTTVNYTVTGADKDSDVKVKARLYYRQQESLADYDYKEVELSEGGATGFITGLEAGMTYEFVLPTGAGLVKKTFNVPDGTLSLALVEDDSDEVNAFDFVRTLQLKNTNDTDTNTYYLQLYYWDGSNYISIGYTTLLSTTNNNYQATFKTADYGNPLLPDTDYHLKWTVSDSYYATTSSCTMYETVHTEKEFSAVLGTGTGTSQSFTASVEDAGNITSFGLHAYIKKKSAASYQTSQHITLSSYDGYSTTATFSGLEAETDYVVSWRLHTFSGFYEEIATTEFKTAEDTRQITVTDISSRAHSAEVPYTCTGGSDSYNYNEYVVLYIREKGDGNTWEYVNDTYFYNHSGTFYVSRYNGEELKIGTTYEYTIGIGDTYNTGVSQLEKTKTGTFQTAEDTRELSGIEVSRKYTSAVITGSCTGSSSDIYSYIHFFLREKKEESSWREYYSIYTSSSSYGFSETFIGLTIGTAYEYAVVISDNDSCSSPDDVAAGKRKQTGEFTTLKCGYTLELKTEELTSDSAVLSVQAKDSNNAADSKVQVVLTLSDGQSETVTLKQSAGYQESVTFSGLEGSKDYTVDNAVISAFVDGSYEVIGSIACNYTFRTKNPIVPESITLSKDAAALNAAYANSDKEGYGCVTLTVTAAAPTDAAKDVTWTSNDEAVAKVDADGKVTAYSAGTATITAASKYDPQVTAKCEIKVKNYVIGQKINGSVEKIAPDTYRTLYKTGTASGYGLYDQSGEELTIVSDATVTFSREGIVSWDNGTLTGNTNGTVYVTMEKDGVKAGCYVTVSLEAQGFGITGFTTSSGYPAQETETGYLLAYAEGGSVAYTAQGELSPAGEFSAGDFTWASSNEDVAAVSAGVVTPKSAGTVTLTVTPNKYYNSIGKYKQEKVEIVLTIKNTPSGTASAVYALANVSSTIGDVDIAEQLGAGWSWKYPKTPLVTNGINKDFYPFEAVYTGEDYYPVEKTVDVYIAKITGMTVSETGAAHNQVLETGGDSLTLSVKPIYQGTLGSGLYTVDCTTKGKLSVDGGNGTYTVMAAQKGKHSVTFALKSKLGSKTLAETKYKITAVEGAQVRGITVTSVTDGVTISGDGKVILDFSDENTKSFTLRAAAVDRSGNEISTNLQWKSSDTSVASVAADKKDTHKAVVTRKGAGHTVITVIAKDTMGCKAYLDVEFQDYAPRVNVSKATVNIAYDYDNVYGKQYASSAGCVEIVPAYGNTVNYGSVTLLKKNGEAQTILKAVQYSGYKYLIMPTDKEIPTDTYDYKLSVTTFNGKSYTYPMKVTVVNKAPTVSAKMGSKPNLFYSTSTGTISLSISGGYRVDTVSWQDQADGEYNGFSLSGSYKTIYVSQQQYIQVANGKLTDKNITKGTLSLKVLGFWNTYTFKNFTIQYTYKKPELTTKNAATTTVVPSIGLNSNYFYVYNKTDKKYMYYDNDDYYYDDYYYDYNYYDELECSSDTVTVEPSSTYYGRLDYKYSGSANQEKFTLTLGSANWREDLQVSHTVKTAQPTAYLSNSQLTYNTVSKSTAKTYIYVKNAADSPSLADVQIKGSNANAQKLLDDDLLTVSWQDGSSYVSVTQNRLDILGEKIPNGTYSYKLTPYYNNAATGEKTALNTLTLKVKVTNKAISASAGAKGTLDLTNKESYSGYSGTPNAKNVVVVDPKLINAGTGYTMSNYKLVGEYSDYFTLAYGYLSSGYHRYIAIEDAGKLKAKQGYKLAIECTVKAPDGDSFTVTSNTFTIKPKQTAAKIKITNNNQTMYAGAADNLTRTYTLSTTSSYYLIESVSGSLDCNKDGTPDIVVSSEYDYDSSYSFPTVTITDRDGVSAAAKGKTLSIPVTVRLKGRDGVSVDAKTTIKVKVMR